MYYTQATYYHHNLLEYMYDMDHRHLTPLLQGALKNMKEILPAALHPPRSFPVAKRKGTRFHCRRGRIGGTSIRSNWQSLISTMANGTHWPVSKPPPPAASTWLTERTKLHHIPITAASNVQPLAPEHWADGHMPTAGEEKVHSGPPPKADQTCVASSKERRTPPGARG